MWALRWGLNLAIGALVLYLAVAWRYGNLRACAAAATAIRAEAPMILDELAARDARFVMFRAGGVASSVTRGAALALLDASIDDGLRDASAVECALVVAQRELSPERFRERAALIVMRGG